MIRFFAFLFLGLPALAVAHDKYVGVIGDSVATGAVSSYTVNATVTSLLYSGVTRGRQAVVFPENSFAMILASQFGVKKENVVNVAANGKRVAAFDEQLAQLIEKLPTRQLPDFLVVSFTANDACNENVFTTPVAEFEKEYERRLLEGRDGKGGLRRLLQIAPKERPTKLIWLAGLNFPQVLSNSEILNHVVPLHFSDVKCTQFRAGAPVSESPALRYIADQLPKMCPAVLKTNPFSNDAESVSRRSQLNNIYQAMIRAQAHAIAVASSENTNSSLRLFYLASPANLKFTGDHVANDCFHLSAQGQSYLGMSAWEELFEQIR